MARHPGSAAGDPSGVPAAHGDDDASAADRATDEGMPEGRPSAAEARAADRAASDAASLETRADDIDAGWIGPTETDDRRGIEEDAGDHDEGGEG